MTINMLITGRLIADTECRSSSSGKNFTMARVSAGSDDESVLCNVIAFSRVADQLAELGKGDIVALSGRTKPKAWASKDGQLRSSLDVVADQVLTIYHLRRKSAAMANATDPSPAWRSASGDRSGRAGGPDSVFEEDAARLHGGSR